MLDVAKSSQAWEIGGPDPLQVAISQVMAESYGVTYDRFLALIGRLCQGRSTILLPVARIGEGFRCDPKLIGRCRVRAIRAGILEEVERYQIGKKATRFKVLGMPPNKQV